ncbi:MFS transporter [Brevibacillus dissolubilis]|uniref:MFS transporter n=1 Tax=Brevibacillus dissolubilis TaxID=1844116 RepID=UPI00210017CB|nr:MFS transporter [Brevibacillus dissolubilis]
MGQEATEKEPSSWKTTLWAMMAVQCIMMMNFTSMGPFLALYVEELGVHDPDEVLVWTGVISCSNFLISALVSPLWGSLADRTGRKLMVMRSTLAISSFTILMAFAANTWQLLIIRILQGVFSGFSASSIALVSTVVPEEKLGYSLGWLQTAGIVGTLIGPLAGGLAADFLDSYRAVFFLASGLSMSAFLVTTFFVKEKFERKTESKSKPSLIQQFKTVGQMKSVHVMFLVLFLTQFSVVSVLPALPVFMKDLTGGAEYLGTLAGFAFAVTGLADLIGSPFLGKRSDQIGYRRVLIISMIGAGLFYLPQALAPNIWVFIASRFGLGLFVGGIMPTANALIGRLVSPEQRGMVFGFTSAATFLGSFAGPLLGGLGSAALGIRWMLGITCVLYLVNMLWVWKKVPEPGRSH